MTDKGLEEGNTSVITNYKSLFKINEENKIDDKYYKIHPENFSMYLLEIFSGGLKYIS